MKTLILSCFAAVALVSLVGCSCDEDHHRDNYQPAVTDDSKDIHPRHHHHVDQ